MLGLIKKDLLMMKANSKILLSTLFIFIIFLLQGGETIYFVPAFFMTVIFMSTFSYDEYNKWNAYAVTLPNGRKNVVKAKYIANLILMALTILFTLVAAITIGSISNNLHIDQLCSSIFGVFFGLTLIQTLSYPIIFKFGVEKGRIALFVGLFGFSILFGFLFQHIHLSIPKNIIEFLNGYYMLYIPILIIFLYLISYFVSLSIYQKKEF